jgi:hypothetical protein
MDLIEIAKTHNQRAVQQKWQHFCDPTLAFTQPKYQALISIWRDKAGNRKMPKRSELTARDLKEFLRDLLLFQRESTNPSIYRWRLIGTKMTEIVGHHTGRTFEESFPSEHLRRWVETSDMILESERPWRLCGRVHISGREYLDAENLYLPLADENNEPSFLLGLCHYTPHVIGQGNYWTDEAISIPEALL